MAGLRLALGYAIVAAVWILATDWLLFVLPLPDRLEAQLSSSKGILFVVVTGLALYTLASRYLWRIHVSEERHSRLFEHATEGLTVFRIAEEPEAHQRLLLDDMNTAQAKRLLIPRQSVIGKFTDEAAEEYPELTQYFRLVEQGIQEGSPVQAELTLPEKGLAELANVYPIRADLWVLGTMDITPLREAQEALATQGKQIRQAYVEVFDAVTGGRLVLLTDDELEERLGEPLGPSRRIESEEQLGEARQAVQQALESSFGEAAATVDFLHPLGEALNNALKHAGSGEYQVFRRDNYGQVAVSDAGSGIDFKTLPKAALQAGYSTTSTLGMGFTIMLHLMERILLVTRPGRTTVVLESPIPTGVREPSVRPQREDVPQGVRGA